jgi:type 1 glutamine amidotransferase/nicotinamidase-related amidase
MIKTMYALLFLMVFMVLGVFFFPPDAHAQTSRFDLTLRTRAQLKDSNSFNVREAQQSWDADTTAVIVCDMWDSHHCFRAVKRVQKLAPEIEKFLQVTRDQGATIIHAPSSCMEFYVEHPARERAVDIPMSKSLPEKIGEWCYQIPAEEAGEYPIDQTDGGEDDGAEEHQRWASELEAHGRDPKAPWKRQIASIKIDSDVDFISVDGKEIWSILESKHIEHILMVGVHTNMCVLGRPFGLRQMVKNNRQIVLVRDLTDAMYNPAAAPFVNHHTGTDLIVEYIEKWVCPTVTSDQIVGGTPFRFSSDTRPRIAMLIGESEYETQRTLPRFAIDALGKDYRVDILHENPESKNDFPGIDRIAEADALFISVRRRLLPKMQLDVIRQFVNSGKPVIGIRTANHAFCLKGKAESQSEGLEAWPEFDAEVFGGNYSGHHANDILTKVELCLLDGDGPGEIVKNIEVDQLVGNGSLYKVSPLAKTTGQLLSGSIPDRESEPVAWYNVRADGGRSFYTSLGHPDDFENPQFVKLLKQAVDWTMQSDAKVKK